MDLWELQLEKTWCSLSVPILSSFSVLHAYSTCTVLCRDGWNVQWEHRPSCLYVWYHQVHFHSMWVDGSGSTESESWRLVKMYYFCSLCLCLLFVSWSCFLTAHYAFLMQLQCTNSKSSLTIQDGGVWVRGRKYLQLQYTGPQRTIDSFLKV